MGISDAPGDIASQGGPLPQRRHPVQRWLLHVVAVLHRWAESGRARSATAAWGFVQASIIPGLPETLIVPLGLADSKRVFSFASAFLLGRSTRLFIVAVIIRFAGARLVGWIERRVGRPFATLR